MRQSEPIKTILTIDDAPSYNFRKKVDFLLSENIPAIFFCIGVQAGTFEDDLVYAVRNGFMLGNHSASHPYFSALTKSQGLAEIERTQHILQRIYEKAGTDPLKVKNHFRFPYGDNGDGKYGYHNAGHAAAKLSYYRKSPLKNLLNHAGKLPSLISPSPNYSAFQQFLRQKGYSACSVNTANETMDKYHQSHFDWRWTFDSRDWSLRFFSPKSKDDQKHLDSLLESAEKHFTGTGQLTHPKTNDPGRHEILLCHDYSYNFEVFKNLIVRLKLLNVRFTDPR